MLFEVLTIVKTAPPVSPPILGGRRGPACSRVLAPATPPRLGGQGGLLSAARGVLADEPRDEHGQVELAEDRLEVGERASRAAQRQDVAVAHCRQRDEAEVQERLESNRSQE